MELRRNIVLRYARIDDERPAGQFTFNPFDPSANDEQLHELGRLLNSFQNHNASMILLQRVLAC